MRAVRTVDVHRSPDAGSELVTQLLPGEEVVVVEKREGWTQVLAPEQPSSLDERGYPGWVRSATLDDDLPALAVARTYLGTPYLWGGLTRAGIDCSGLVHVAFRTVGFQVPRDAADQSAAAAPVPAGEERSGDLMVFARPGARVHHIGFLTEVGVLHASDAASAVVEEPLPDERRETLRGLRRLSP